jgi:hypothetical protein
MYGYVTTERADGGETCDMQVMCKHTRRALVGRWADDITGILAYSLTSVHQDTCWHRIWTHV